MQELQGITYHHQIENFNILFHASVCRRRVGLGLKDGILMILNLLFLFNLNANYSKQREKSKIRVINKYSYGTMRNRMLKYTAEIQNNEW